MFKTLLLVFFEFIAINTINSAFPEKEFSIEFTPLLPTNETLIQTFECNTESNVKSLNYEKYFETKISCNDWSFKKMNTSFNITTIDKKSQSLALNNMNTFSAHVNGHLILMQTGQITEGVCAGGKFDKLVFNMVNPNACDGQGVQIQDTLYASVKITGGYCQSFCFGKVFVKFNPGVGNQ